MLTLRQCWILWKTRPMSIHLAFWKESMINRLSSNRSAAKMSQVLCSSNYRSWGKRSDQNILSSNDQIRELGLAKLDFVMFLLSCWSVSRWCFLLDFLDISTGYLSADRVSTDCLSGTKHSSKHDSEQSLLHQPVSYFFKSLSPPWKWGEKTSWYISEINGWLNMNIRSFSRCNLLSKF